MKFLDTFDLPDGQILETDVCIIGGGAAGIAMARELARRNIDTMLLESGGLEFEDEQQDLYDGVVDTRGGGLNYDVGGTRARYFGGTTNLWAGLSAPFSEMDMSVRDWIPSSGWPFGRSEIDPFYRQAHDLIGLGDFDYTEEGYKKKFGEIPVEFKSSKITNKLYKAFPLRFNTLSDELAEYLTLRVFLHAACADIVLTDNGRQVSHIDLKNLRGWSGQVRARKFVLSCGGIENPRLLLNSTSVQKDGVGNDRDLVGRFFMEHPHLDCAQLISSSSVDWIARYRNWRPEHAWHWWALGPTDAAQKRLKIANIGMTVEKPRSYPSLPGDTSIEFLERLNDPTTVDIDSTAVRQGAAKLYARMEQVPNPDSRITLVDETDQLGLRRVKLNWRLNEIDKLTVIETTKLIAEELGRLGIGRVKFDSWQLDESPWNKISLWGGHHHMGTTRMGNDPSTSVVDANCLVHGLRNLYVAGSSVFPTSSYVNPTLTLVAVALRLANHLGSTSGQ
jgi:choline dehydrogenase-like flavoprotein